MSASEDGNSVPPPRKLRSSCANYPPSKRYGKGGSTAAGDTCQLETGETVQNEQKRNDEACTAVG